MKNPLIKRIPKELLNDFGKYIIIFLFMTATIGFISGFLVAGNSMITAYNNSFDKYNIENGNFELNEKASGQLLSIFEDNDVTIYENTYKQENILKFNETTSSSTLRIFQNRKDVNLVCLMTGDIPSSNKEIAIDRMFANNNDISIGDTLTINSLTLTVTGFIALPDYSTLFSDNTDMMFDAVKFGVAIMTPSGFTQINNTNIHYSYSWLYNTPPDNEYIEKEKSDTFMKTLYSNASILQYIPRYNNQAITFTGSDLGGDRSMMIMLLYILIAIIAFVFAVTTSNTISKEASVIGTLRASGYTKLEIICHYLSMPLIITILSCIVGNILGYTIFKNVAASMYYNSYSLTTYKTLWNFDAFVLTTVIPFIIMLIINLFILINKLQLSPLRFLRHDFKKKFKKKTMRLPRFKFLNRFRLRIIFQNMPSYFMLLIGIIFANLLLLFGMMMSPLLHHYQDEIENTMISDYQYILKAPASTDNDNVEKYASYSLKTLANEETINIYGINQNSNFVNIDFNSNNTGKSSNSVFVSKGILEKYQYKVGDTITLQEKYNDNKHSFTIAGYYNYPASLVIFMDIEHFCKEFDQTSEYFNGYFSNEKITDIDSPYIATTITKEDLTKTSRQLEVSMGKMFYLINVFAIILYMLLIYLLSKLVIEKNTTSISMVKILGYTNKETKKLYMTSTTIITIISLLISIPIDIIFIKIIYQNMMQDFSGWLTLYISPSVCIEMIILGIISYLLISVILYKKIASIPMDEALKNVE